MCLPPKNNNNNNKQANNNKQPTDQKTPLLKAKERQLSGHLSRLVPHHKQDRLGWPAYPPKTRQTLNWQPLPAKQLNWHRSGSSAPQWKGTALELNTLRFHFVIWGPLYCQMKARTWGRWNTKIVSVPVQTPDRLAETGDALCGHLRFQG